MIMCYYFHVPLTYVSSLLSESLEQAKNFTVILQLYTQLLPLRKLVECCTSIAEVKGSNPVQA